jgi:phage tail-like protein
MQTIRYREAGKRSYVRAIPGPVEYPDVTLRYGITNSSAIWDWVNAAITGSRQNGIPMRRNVSIYLLHPDGEDGAINWVLTNAFPCEWLAAPLNAMGSAAAIGTLCLSYDELTQEKTQEKKS